ncbi:hypothetical protein VPH35_094549 [Triticum aestivum]
MWRSFLARSQPVLSQLGRPSGCSAAAGCRSRGRTSTRHLYVVLDEMKTGHGIYRLDVDDLDGGDADAVTGMYTAGRASEQTMAPPPCRLPEPLLRLGNSSVGSTANFAAVGSKIVVTGRTHRGYGDVIITLVYDTKMARLDIEQPPPASFKSYSWRKHDYRHSVAVRNKLYMFDQGWIRPHYLCEQQGMKFGQGGHFTEEEDETMLDMRGQTMEWIWKKGPSFPGQEELCFVQPVQSHAVHPDGRTIFVSCFGGSNNDSKPKAPFTFSLDTEHGGDLDTENQQGVSTLRREWSMPFHGRAYYDRHLDAWVGIRKVSGRPYLCSCDVPNLTDDHGYPPTKPLPAPEWRTCKEELTFLAGASGHALVHTGRGRFCLVEAKPVVPHVGGEPNQCNRCTMYHGNEHLLHVTMFCTKHGKDGELMIAPCRPGRSYLVPNYCQDAAENPPIAFWM